MYGLTRVWFGAVKILKKKKFKLLAFSMWRLSFCLAGTYYHRKQPLLDAVATPRNFFRVFLKKYKLHNLIKRKFYMWTITTIKKHANT